MRYFKIGRINNTLSLELFSDKDALSIFYNIGKPRLYVGPLGYIEEYFSDITHIDLTMLIGLVFRALLSKVSEFYFDGSAQYKINTKIGVDMTAAWVEIVNNKGIKSMSNSELYAYFLKNSDDIDKLLVFADTQIALRLINQVYFNCEILGLCEPNKDISALIRMKSYMNKQP